MLRRRSLTPCIFLALILSLALSFGTVGASQLITVSPAAASLVSELASVRPQDPITGAEAAEVLVRSFQLATIKPLIVPGPVQKKFVYTDTLGVIDEGFAVPSASDIAGHAAVEFIEGLFKARAIDEGNGPFRPDEPMAGTTFVEALGRIVFGVDPQIERNAQLKAVFGIDAANWSDGPMGRLQAAELIEKVTGSDGFGTVTVLVTSDIHGHLEPYKPGTSKYAIGGMSRMAEFVRDLKAGNPNVILVDVGDAPYNTNVANLFEGKPVMEVMNYMGYDAMAIGNHDFDFPQDVMKRNAGLADFPFLSANTYREGHRPEYLIPSVVVTAAGRDFGIIGLTDDRSAVYTHPNNVKGITYNDHFEAAAEEVESIRDKVDVVIALAHLHGDNYILPERVKGIDFEMGGGNDVVAFPQLIGDTWLISPGKHSEAVGVLNINFLGNKMVGFNFGHVFMTENLPEDGFVADLIALYATELNTKMAQPIGSTGVFLDGERATVRLKESNLGNLVADALKHLTDADIAFQNGGGIRASIKEGSITLKDAYTVLPFDNRVVVIEATGRTVWEALENGVAPYPSAAGQFLQVSGVEYTFDAAREAGSRITSVTMDGKPIELDKVYRVVANDFLTGGGDHYTMLQSCKIVLDTKLYLRDAFTEYVRSLGIVNPKLEGRITILNSKDN